MRTLGGLEYRFSQRNLGERRKQDDVGARILGAQDQHFGLKAANVARRHVDHAGHQPATRAGSQVKVLSAGRIHRTRPATGTTYASGRNGEQAPDKRWGRAPDRRRDKRRLRFFH